MSNTPRKSRAGLPKHSQIVNAQNLLLKILSKTIRDNPERSCWSCGLIYSNAKPVRAHMESNETMGKMHPANFLLLCRKCQNNQPTGASRELQIMWLRDGFTHRGFSLEFSKAAGVDLKSVMAIIAERYGDKNAPNIVRRAIQAGKRFKPSRKPGNMMKRTASYFKLKFKREINLAKLRIENKKLLPAKSQSS